MTVTNPTRIPRAEALHPTTGPATALTGALAGALIFAAVFQSSLSPGALLSASSMLLFTFAAVIALIAWRRPVRGRQFTYWDAAGLLTLIGVCVGAAVEPEQMVRLVAGAEPRP
jgi:uncharacterized membrane protein YfcA